MSVLVPGVPTSITRKQLTTLVESLGIDPEGCAEVHIDRDKIEAVVYARNADGHFYVQDDDVAKHHLSIEVVEP